MYTQCPECQTVFRVGAQQLRAAEGQVRCGRCRTVFDALTHPAARNAERLTSPPEPPEAAKAATAEPAASPDTVPIPPQPAQAEVSVAAAGERDSVPGLEDSPPSGSSPAEVDSEPTGREWHSFSEESIEALLRSTEEVEETAAAAETPEAFDDLPIDAEPAAPVGSGAPAPNPSPSLSEHRLPPTEPEIASAPHRGPARKQPLPENVEPEAEEPLPLQLQARPRKRGAGATLLWSFGVLLLLAGLGGQYAYFHRHELALRADWRPYLEQLCEVARCDLPPRRDLGAIELTDHAVQSHPRRNGALLITATLLNRAGFAQPYPDVEVVMMDIEQRAVASRRFTPAEYLAGRSPDGLFPPDTDAHLMLEVVDPGRRAVSFEFDFR